MAHMPSQRPGLRPDYVHSQGVRHKDIKPQNIICKGSEIFLTDFGSAHKFTETSSATEGHAGRVTYMYSAPEVISQGKKGRSADIFSLGCVFSEIATVITSRRIEDFYDHRVAPKIEDPEETTQRFHATQDKIKTWFQTSSWPEIYDLLSIMLSREPSHRPRAFEVVATLVASTIHPICKCVDGPILLPKNWDLSIQFELLPGLVEHSSPGSTYGIPMPRPEEILQKAKREAEATRSNFIPGGQAQEDVVHSPDLLGSLLALMEDPGNSDLQKKYSAAEAISLPDGLKSLKQDADDGFGKFHVFFDVPPLAPPQRPRRDFSSTQPLMTECSPEEAYPELI